MRRMTGLLFACAAWAQDVSLAEAEKKVRARDFAAALAEYDKAVAEAPGDARGHAGRALALQALGRRDEAIAAITRAIDIKPGGAYFQQRGLLCLAGGDEVAALADFTKGIEIDPAAGILYRRRGDVLFVQHDYAGALKDYSKAYELDPHDVTALERRGQTKEALRDFNGAVDDYALLVDAAPNHPRPFSMRGNAKFRLGDLKGAIGDFDAALYVNEEDTHAYVARARARLALGEKEAADADAAKAGAGAARAEAFAERGRYYYDTGRPKEAVADLAKAVQMDPRGQDYTRLFLFLSRAKLGARAEAAPELKAYADGRETKEDWYAKVAAFLSGQTKEEEFLAAAKAENVHLAREQECEACWYAGAVRLLDGDVAGAKALFERCVATDVRTFIEYESAKAALAAMK